MKQIRSGRSSLLLWPHSHPYPHRILAIAAARYLYLDHLLEHRRVISAVVVVLTLAVPPQIDLTLEGLFAEAAGEGLVPGVLPHVRDQVGALAERLLADDAFVRLLTWGEGERRKGNSRSGWWLMIQRTSNVRTIQFVFVDSRGGQLPHSANSGGAVNLIVLLLTQIITRTLSVRSIRQIVLWAAWVNRHPRTNWIWIN